MAVTAVVLTVPPIAAAAAQAASQGLVTISGNVSPGLESAQRVAPLDGTLPLDFTVVLAPRDAPGLERFAAAVSDPKSAEYGRYITPEVFADRFGPTPEAVATVRNYLGSRGLSVRSVDPNRLAVHASGRVASIETAFGTSLSSWHDTAQGRDFVANATGPRMPAPVAALVGSVMGLDNHHPARHHAQVSATSGSRGTGTGHFPGAFTPSDLHAAYDIDTALGTGAGQSVGLYELDRFQSTTVNTYFQMSYGGRTGPPISTIAVDGFPTSGPPVTVFGGVEAELDIEVLNAIAPGASLRVWEGYNGAVPGQPTSVLDGTYDVYASMINSNSTRVNSTSWGDCESNVPNGFKDALHSLLLQAAGQGQTWFAASGDNGVYDCAPPSTNNPRTVDYPASDPAMTGVGGTALTTSGTQAYAGETGWGGIPPPGSSGSTTGGGGGFSNYFSQPGWQAGPGVSEPLFPNQRGTRQVPDVSSDADPNTGFDTYTTVSTGGTPAWYSIGGTSAAAPLWAGFAALYDNWALANGKPNLGFAAPVLYQVAAQRQTYPPYHDVVAGGNGFFPAGPGWDFATGLGSYDAYGLVRDLAAILYLPPAFASASGGSGYATVAWSPPLASSNTIIKYTVTASPGGQVATVGPTAGSATVYGLDPGTYSFTVAAVYTGGNGSTTTNPITVGQFVPAVRQGTPWDGGSDAVGIPAGALDAYFAEGTTRLGFDEYLTIQTGAGQAVNIDYIFTDASTLTKSYNLPPNSRSTVFVNRDVGPGQDVAVHIHGTAPFVAERPMYFNFQGRTGGHDVVGATAPGTHFLFAEGTTQTGFQEYLTLFNPGDTVSNATVRYFTQGGPLAPVPHALQPHSRTTIDVNAEAGPGLDVALQVDSDVPILAERPMYFTFNGWTGGHDVAGAAAPSTTANLAEGLVRGGSFIEYLTILNPNAADAKVQLSFLLPGGTVVPIGPIPVRAGSRATVPVASLLPDGTSSSVHVSSDLPVVVERPMYFNFQGINGGHDAMGLPDAALGPAAILAEGFTGGSFHEFLTILNNSGVTTVATVTYYVTDPTNNTTSVVKRPYSLVMHSRTTIDVNQEVGPNKSVSVRVDTNPDLPGTGPATPIEVERPLYFAY